MSLTAAGILGALLLAAPTGVEHSNQGDAFRAAVKHFHSVNAPAAFFCRRVIYGVEHVLIVGKTAQGDLHYQRIVPHSEKWLLSTPRFFPEKRYRWQCEDKNSKRIDAYLIR